MHLFDDIPESDQAEAEIDPLGRKSVGEAEGARLQSGDLVAHTAGDIKNKDDIRPGAGAAADQFHFDRRLQQSLLAHLEMVGGQIGESGTALRIDDRDEAPDDGKSLGIDAVDRDVHPGIEGIGTAADAENRAVIADCPAGVGSDHPDGIELCGHAALLQGPGGPAVPCAVDASALSDSDDVAPVGETEIVEAEGADRKRAPGGAAVDRPQHFAVGGNRPAAHRVNEFHTADGAGDAAVLDAPGGAAVERLHDHARIADYPAGLLIDERDVVKGLVRRSVLGGPYRTTVDRLFDQPLGADIPADRTADHDIGMEGHGAVRRPRRPGGAAVGALHGQARAGAALAHQPSRRRVGEEEIAHHRFGGDSAGAPARSAVGAAHDHPVVAGRNHAQAVGHDGIEVAGRARRFS